MRKTNFWKTVVLLGACVWLGVKNGIRYGWLSGHANIHPLTNRIGVKLRTLEEML